MNKLKIGDGVSIEIGDAIINMGAINKLKNKMEISKQVDLLLEHGIDNPEKWMSVHKYEEPTWQTNDSHGWAVEYRKLLEHHTDETTFLYKVIEELINRKNNTDIMISNIV